MTTSEQVANLLLRGEVRGSLRREEIDDLACDLTPDARAFQYKRLEIHGIEIVESRRPTPPRRAATPPSAAR
ncbi:MAG TPA: hypothetical protein VM184_01205 [Gaiellaceae bacterium]|nr:hypothetical protein [Gaiellaceae bacterium]